MSRNMKTNNKKHKVLKSFSILVAFVLVIGITVAITLALLNKKSDPVVNTFVAKSDIDDMEIGEPSWDGEDPDPGATPRPTPGPGVDPTPEPGKNKAESYTPGMEIGKDPTWYNTTKVKIDTEGKTAEQIEAAIAKEKETNLWKSACAYVAIKLEYQIWDGRKVTTTDPLTEEEKKYDPDDENSNWKNATYEDIVQLAKIYSDNSSDTNKIGFSQNWVANDDKTVFYYKNILNPYVSDKDGNIINVSGYGPQTDYKTDPLFDTLKVPTDISQDTEHTFSATLGTLYEKDVKGNDVYGVYKDAEGFVLESQNGDRVKNSNGKYIKGTIYADSTGKLMDKNGDYIKDESGADITVTTSGQAKKTGLIPFRIIVQGYAIQAYVDGKPMVAPGGTATDANATEKAQEELDKFMAE